MRNSVTEIVWKVKDRLFHLRQEHDNFIRKITEVKLVSGIIKLNYVTPDTGVPIIRNLQLLNRVIGARTPDKDPNNRTGALLSIHRSEYFSFFESANIDYILIFLRLNQSEEDTDHNIVNYIFTYTSAFSAKEL